MSSRGKLILMADADGATKFPDLEKVEAGLSQLNPKPVCLLFHLSQTCTAASVWMLLKMLVYPSRTIWQFPVVPGHTWKKSL